MAVARYDIGQLKKPVRLANGFLRVDGYITRTGVFDYQRADGSTFREYRPPEEVFKTDAMDFEGMPLTNDHPSQDGKRLLLTAENAKDFTVGSVTKIRRDGKKMAATMLVTDSAMIAALESGQTGISCGYLADVEIKSGVSPDGEHYDGIQRNIVPNHVALVPPGLGRGGSDVRVRMDSTDAAMLICEADPEPVTKSQGVKMLKVKFDSVEVEVSEDAAKAIESERAAAQKVLDSVKNISEKSAARADSAEAELTKVKTELAGAPEKIRAQIQARVELENSAKKVLGEAEKFDGLADSDVKVKVVAKVNPTLKLDGKSEAYVDGAFETALAQHAAQPGSGLDSLQAVKLKTDSADSLEALKAKFEEACRNAHLVK